MMALQLYMDKGDLELLVREVSLIFPHMTKLYGQRWRDVLQNAGSKGQAARYF
jgi:hypothetical protein